MKSQGVSQKIKTDDVYSKLVNKTSVYQGHHHSWQQELFLLQAIEWEQMPCWERNISKHDIINHKHVTTDKCFFLYSSFTLGWDTE